MCDSKNEIVDFLGNLNKSFLELFDIGSEKLAKVKADQDAKDAKAEVKPLGIDYDENWRD